MNRKTIFLLTAIALVAVSAFAGPLIAKAISHQRGPSSSARDTADFTMWFDPPQPAIGETFTVHISGDPAAYIELGVDNWQYVEHFSGGWQPWPSSGREGNPNSILPYSWIVRINQAGSYIFTFYINCNTGCENMAQSTIDIPDSIPDLITYQGYLTDASGNPLQNQVEHLKFDIYATLTSSDPLWTEVYNNLPVTDGYFTVFLGSTTPFSSTLFSGERWLQLSVDTGEGYTALDRQQFTSVPFALNAATLDGRKVTDFASSTHSHPSLGCRVIRETAQAIPNDTTLPITFTTTINDTSDCWSDTEPTRLYATASGYYMAGGEISFPSDQVTSAGLVSLMIQQNGDTYLQSAKVPAVVGSSVYQSISTGMFYMDAGDYIEVIVHHNFGSAKNTFAASASNQHYVNAWLARLN